MMEPVNAGTSQRYQPQINQIMKQILQGLMLGLAAVLLLTSPLKAADRSFTGIQGRTFLYMSYGTPVEVEPGMWIGIPSVQLPVSASFSVLSVRTRREVARGTSDAAGAFAVALPPGKYILVPQDLMVRGFPSPTTIATSPIGVTVRPQRQTTANVFYFQGEPLTYVGLSGFQLAEPQRSLNSATTGR